MNELQRQTYLSALGIESYMPRWQLPFAPAAVACELPVGLDASFYEPQLLAGANLAPIEPPISVGRVNADVSPVNSLISDMLETKKPTKTIAPVVTAADILAQLDTKPAVLEPFTLSVWRPLGGVMVIDSRNTKLALPTEVLLSNILRNLFKGQSLNLQEEVLRWPMIENSFSKRTLSDARNELQTWMTVQHEIRPLHFLLLMGSNASSYFLPEQASYESSLFHTVAIADAAIKALILPDLNCLLQHPLQKRSLTAAFHHYLSLS